MEDLTLYHGTPADLSIGGILVPGAERSHDRFIMERNKAVFSTTRFELAVNMGAWRSADNRHCLHEPGIDFMARYIYVVERIGSYRDHDGFNVPGDNAAPHSRCFDDEYQSRQAVIVGKYKMLPWSTLVAMWVEHFPLHLQTLQDRLGWTAYECRNYLSEDRPACEWLEREERYTRVA